MIEYYTQEGYDKLKKEVERLESIERPKISKMIAEARDKGDLSENAEYDAAKEAQGMLEAKIAKKKESLGKAKIIDKSKVDTSKVTLLTHVKIKNIKNGFEQTYHIVPESESDVKKGKISVNSPIAKALLGKKAGQKVDAKVPAGVISLEILNISV